MNAGNVRRIERLNYLLGGILIVAAALTQRQSVALGVAVGVALTCLNFLFFRRLIVKWTSDAAEGRPSAGSATLMLPKTLLLMLAVVLSLAFLPIHPVAFAIGYSVFVLSIFTEIILSAFQPSNEQNHG